MSTTILLFYEHKSFVSLRMYLYRIYKLGLFDEYSIVHQELVHGCTDGCSESTFLCSCVLMSEL